MIDIYLNFWVFKSKSSNLEGWTNWTNWSVSQKVQRSIFMKCSILYGCLNGRVQFLNFKNFYLVFGWGQSLGTNLGF